VAGATQVATSYLQWRRRLRLSGVGNALRDCLVCDGQVVVAIGPQALNVSPPTSAQVARAEARHLAASAHGGASGSGGAGWLRRPRSRRREWFRRHWRKVVRAEAAALAVSAARSWEAGVVRLLAQSRAAQVDVVARSVSAVAARVAPSGAPVVRVAWFRVAQAALAAASAGAQVEAVGPAVPAAVLMAAETRFRPTRATPMAEKARRAGRGQRRWQERFFPARPTRAARRDWATQAATVIWATVLRITSVFPSACSAPPCCGGRLRRRGRQESDTAGPIGSDFPSTASFPSSSLPDSWRTFMKLARKRRCCFVIVRYLQRKTIAEPHWPWVESSHAALGTVPASEVGHLDAGRNAPRRRAPDPRYLQTAAFDETRKVLVMFGGQR